MDQAVESGGCSDLLAQRAGLHRRDGGGDGEAHLRQRSANIPDPTGLFNSSMEGNTRRAIDIHEGQQVDAVEFKTLATAEGGRPECEEGQGLIVTNHGAEGII